MCANPVSKQKDPANQRRRREEQQVELRRQRTEELLNKKRVSTREAQSSNTFEATKSLLFSNNLEDIYGGTYDCRTRLSIDVNPPIQDIVVSGIVPRFVELLDKNFYTQFGDNPLSSKCRFEAAWVITNIASGNSEQTKYVVNVGAVPLLVKMISEDDEGILDQSVWALANISGDSEALRDIILEAGALQKVADLILKYINTSGNIKILRNLVWLVSNLNRGRYPAPTLENMQKSFFVIEKVIQINDQDLVSDAFWCLSYLADASSEMTDSILKSSAMKRMFDLLSNFCGALQKPDSDNKLSKIGASAICPIVRTLGNIVTGTEEQTNAVISMGFLQFFHPIFYLYDNKKLPRIRKEICWLLSNVTAGSATQIVYVLEGDLVGLVIDSVNKHDLFIKKEAGIALFNMLYFCKANPQYLQKLLDMGALQALQNYLKAVGNLPESQSKILDCVRCSLEAGEKIKQKYGINPVIQILIDTKFIDEIEELQNPTTSSVIARQAYDIIVTYFEGEEENL
ncbi:uncharacterized protein VICG_02059 [Vittaforma corneae ATCC 50505]|uniref:Importin subunit alpha n=1 Tax=Vittaforma corneae (strain ATCC 50505) TaxID=993615 RepID=L2GJV7_VITCO|nr:uncharacterized protein VICG_02059 [Vittaforma corneae ATCC 50505]ELA40919.1 hypothetical protein VICG_02059 [Vittaforma corneae ATCC 50505]